MLLVKRLAATCGHTLGHVRGIPTEHRSCFGPQDRRLLGRGQPARLAQRPRRAINQRRGHAAAVDPAMPPAMSGRRRHAEAGCSPLQRYPDSIASTNSRRPADPSLALACRSITALLLDMGPWQNPHTLKGGPVNSLSAVHNLCGQIS